MYYVNLDGKEWYNVKCQFKKNRVYILDRHNKTIYKKKIKRIQDLFIEKIEGA